MCQKIVLYRLYLHIITLINWIWWMALYNVIVDSCSIIYHITTNCLLLCEPLWRHIPRDVTWRHRPRDVTLGHHTPPSGSRSGSDWSTEESNQTRYIWVHLWPTLTNLTGQSFDQLWPTLTNFDQSDRSKV